jgi:hypothetical protein
MFGVSDEWRPMTSDEDALAARHARQKWAPGAERYAFFASQLRLGARVLFPHVEVGVELQDTRLTGLPDDATLGAPFGPLGTGATYFLFTHHTTQGEPFLKQGFVTLRRGGAAATLGRFEYRDGLETVPRMRRSRS